MTTKGMHDSDIQQQFSQIKQETDCIVSGSPSLNKMLQHAQYKTQSNDTYTA